MASTYLSRSTNSGSTGTKWTFSAWVKRAGTGENNCIWNQSNDANNTTYNEVAIKSANELDVQIRNGTSGDNGTYIRRRTSRLFRDCNAFYHIVVRYDSTNSTAGDRLRLYVNGVQETSMQESVGTVPQNQVTVMATSGADQTFGRGVGSSNHYWNGVISHAHLCDGYSYAPSEFGETDSTTGEWKIKTSPSVSYGTNGWWILKDGNSVTDSSPNSNAFSVTAGTLTKTEDNPSNVFATVSAVIGNHSNGNALQPTLENANTVSVYGSGEWRIAQSTLGASSGKYYAEIKWIEDANTRYSYIGLYDVDGYAEKISGYPYMADMANCYGLKDSNGNINSGASSTSYGVSYSTGNIIGVAMDLDNNKLYFSKDGVWMNSANPSNGTGGYSITANKTYVIGIQQYAVGYLRFAHNYGNGYFQTTEITTNTGTGYQDADGNGRFYYAVPTNFRCLSTKGLNQ